MGDVERHQRARPKQHRDPFTRAMGRYLHKAWGPRVVTSDAATVPGELNRARARAMFSWALWRLAPHVMVDLGDVDVLLDHLDDLDERVDHAPGYVQRSMDRAERTHAHVKAWQQRYHLTDAWLCSAARNTIPAMLHAGEMLPLGPAFEDMGITPHDKIGWVECEVGVDRKTASLYRQTTQTIWMGDLIHSRDEAKTGSRASDEPIGMFDPRCETAEDAMKRIMPVLESKLGTVLEAIEEEDITQDGAERPLEHRKCTSFEWLVRYQVLDENQVAIAEGDGRHRSHVTREINKAADLVGLALREPKRGRPRKKSANTIRLR